MIRDTAIVAAAFALGTLVAELAGASNLGIALSVGQLCFMAALVYVLLRRPGATREETDEPAL
jgi:hypothetical protein